MNIITARITSHEEDLKHNGQYYCDLFIEAKIETDYDPAEMNLRIDRDVLADWVIKKGLRRHTDHACDLVWSNGESGLTEEVLIQCLTDVLRNREDEKTIIELQKKVHALDDILSRDSMPSF